MKTSIQKWGDSLAIRIPAVYAQDIAFQEGTRVVITVENGCLLIKPASDVPEYSLDDLLKGISADNLHKEVDMGNPAGNEEW